MNSNQKKAAKDIVKDNPREYKKKCNEQRTDNKS